MIVVPVKEGENIEKALKKFKRKFEKTGIVKELRSRQHNRLYIYKKTKYRRRLLRFPFFQKAIHRKSLILYIK